MKLRGFILSLENVVYHRNRLEQEAFREVGRFVRFLLSKGIQPVIVANRTRRLADEKLQSFIDREWPVVPWFVAEEGTGEWKPRTAATAKVFETMGWQPEEVAYLGNSLDDMRTAKNGGVLFLNAEWFTHSADYGLRFGTVRDLARFVDVCCLREHLWHFVIDEPDLQVLALSPYSTYKEAYASYSEHARLVLKRGGEHIDFWTKYLSSSIYFSKLHRVLDYVAPFPGHLKGVGNPLLDELLTESATCFGVPYLRDLIIRHTDAPKSQTDRAGASHLRQLNSICLNPAPLRSRGETRYKNCPLRPGKTVLVVDDFCTAGHSLEAARTYISQTGASVVCAAFLKTINTDYKQLIGVERFDPYVPNTFSSPLGSERVHSYHRHIADSAAPAELAEGLRRYLTWEWPVAL